MEERQVFLVQTSGNEAKHRFRSYQDRTYADELILHHYYRNDDWEKHQNQRAFGTAKAGDYVLQYCTSNVESCVTQIKHIYEIVNLENINEDIDLALKRKEINIEEARNAKQHPHRMLLTSHKTLNTGFSLTLIKNLVDEGKLSENMRKCGQIGFNICLVEWKDYEAIVEWERVQPIAPPDFDHLEEDLRQYIAAKNSLDFLGSAYEGFKLYIDSIGRNGVEYNTNAVGRIDLLFHNSMTNEFLVVELKRTQDTPDRAAGQIARYIGWVRKNLANGDNVRGLLIVRSASEELRYAVPEIKDCQLATYELMFDIKLTG